jgi:hypothetical protein
MGIAEVDVSPEVLFTNRLRCRAMPRGRSRTNLPQKRKRHLSKNGQAPRLSDED